MLKIIKQYFCRHESIHISTDMNTENSFIIARTLIQCADCKKSFPQHPNAQCCYVMHIHSQILQEQYMKQLKGFQQCQQPQQPQTQ